MSRDYEHHATEEKKSSGVAKAGMVTGITALGLIGAGALSNGNLFGNNGCGNNRGLLGNLFGGNSNDGLCVYQQEKMDTGVAAKTELDMLNKYVLPLASKVSSLETLAAVNAESDAKNQIINDLKFQIVSNNAACCCDKTNLRIDAIYDKLSSQDQCNYDRLAAANQYTYDRLAADTICNFQRLDAKIDSNFNLRDAIVDGQFAAADARLEKAMCGVIKGQPYLSPSNLADPYTSGRNMIVSRNVTPVLATYGGCGSTFNTGCGCGYNEWAW